MMNESYYKSLLLGFFLAPLVAALSSYFVRKNKMTVRIIALLSFAIQISILLVFVLNQNLYGWDNFGPLYSMAWMPQWGINLVLGIDGITLPFLLISSILAPIIYMLVLPLENPEKFFSSSVLFLFMLFGMYGSFLCLDLVVFYLLWELVLIPIFILVGLGKGPNRQSALMKFFLYSLGSSLFMLLGIMLLGLNYQATFGTLSFNFFNLKQNYLPWFADAPFSSMQWWACLGFILAFLTKGHAFPLHSWLPGLYKQGTPLATVSVAALLFNMAAYAMIRFLPTFFPHALNWWSEPLMLLGGVGILYGALCVLAQSDLRKVLAFMSVSHMGFFILGFGTLTSAGIQAAYIQTINHAILAASFSILIFLMAQSNDSYKLSNWNGVIKTMPLLSIAFFIALLGNIGLPGTNGFVGEFLVLISSFQKTPVIASMATIGVILSATYGLIIFQKLFFNNISQPAGNGNLDLQGRNLIFVMALMVLIILLGVKPMNFFQPAMETLHKLTMVVLP